MDDVENGGINKMERSDLKAQTWCVPNSILCAWTFGGKHHVPVRIAISNIARGTDHAQAQALIDGKWEYLTELWSGEYMYVTPWTSHYPEIEPYRTPSLRDFIAEQMALFEVK